MKCFCLLVIGNVIPIFSSNLQGKPKNIAGYSTMPQYVSISHSSDILCCRMIQNIGTKFNCIIMRPMYYGVSEKIVQCE